MDYFGEDTEVIRGKNWDWKNFESTKGYPVSDNLLEWVIGQERALDECYLCLEEWVHKLKNLKQEKWYDAWTDPDKEKPNVTKTAPPGPYLLLLGDPGTGKSLIGRALSVHLTELYKKEDIKLQDVVCWQNDIIPGEPKISSHPAGDGKKILLKQKLKEAKRQFLQRIGVKAIIYLMIIVASIFMFAGFYYLWQEKLAWDMNVPGAFGEPVQTVYNGNFGSFMLDNFVAIGTTTFLPAGMMLMFLILVTVLGRFGIMGGAKGIGGAKSSKVPKLIVDNSKKAAPFIDATGHGSAQLFGSIAWDPFQTGGMGTPEHQRVTAGGVHRAHQGILYIDEIKNMAPDEAITLLTVLEDGQLPITMRSRLGGASGTAAMSVATEPVPCMCFLVGAGNYDSIGQVHPALMDRIYGYGKVVRMNNTMPNTMENRRKYVQFIAQEVSRFRLLPFSKEACEEIINEGRRRSNKNNALSTKLRPMISIVKTAGTLAMNEDLKFVEAKHVKEAIENHCKTIQKQILEHQMSERGQLLDISPEGSKLGQIYGVAVVKDSYSGEMTGNVLAVKGFLEKRDKRFDKSLRGYYNVTGIAKEGQEQFIADSVCKVRSVILQKYGVDIAQEFFTHIDFAQAYRVDGPSAGVTMTILLCSLLEGKPIRQDVAVTGEINVGVHDVVPVTAVGGVHEKIKAAEMWGFKKVIVPAKNYKHSIEPQDYSIEVVPGETLDDYLRESLVNTDEESVQDK
ncbi:MAG: AAA family ATPase [Candidatus Bathyarchaeota archaeon]|nr:AAA family ATPase [Candidatus Bathyarchaeum tardum]WGM89481.1 MAG: AAA family ATPase [Candidatus Bathyarchaeum tardum]